MQREQAALGASLFLFSGPVLQVGGQHSSPLPFPILVLFAGYATNRSIGRSSEDRDTDSQGQSPSNPTTVHEPRSQSLSLAVSLY